MMFKKALGVGLCATLLLSGAGSFTPVEGRSQFGVGSFGGELRGMTRITGLIVCTGCSLDNVKEDPAELMQHQLYQLQHDGQQAVLRVTAIGDQARTGNQDASQVAYWQAVTGLNKQLSVRTGATMWQTLTAPENLRKPVELNCFLRSTKTLDIAEMTFPQ
jgi:hypothetical protein